MQALLKLGRGDTGIVDLAEALEHNRRVAVKESLMRVAICLLLTTLACASGNKTSTGRTEREKDSVIANSKVPGAPAVKRSMAVADSASARVKVQDSIAKSEGE